VSKGNWSMGNWKPSFPMLANYRRLPQAVRAFALTFPPRPPRRRSPALAAHGRASY
jgi:hypothetical protein